MNILDNSVPSHTLAKVKMTIIVKTKPHWFPTCVYTEKSFRTLTGHVRDYHILKTKCALHRYPALVSFSRCWHAAGHLECYGMMKLRKTLNGFHTCLLEGLFLWLFCRHSTMRETKG